MGGRTVKDTWLSDRFWRLARRIGKKIAIVATADAIVIAIWHIRTNRCDYADLAIDWWEKRSSLRKRDRTVEALA